MACLGYFSKNQSELRMPRTHDWRDNPRASWKGRALTGEQSVEEALATDDAHVRQTPRHLENERRFGRRTEQLDHVLQSHLDTK